VMTRLLTTGGAGVATGAAVAGGCVAGGCVVAGVCVVGAGACVVAASEDTGAAVTVGAAVVAAGAAVTAAVAVGSGVFRDTGAAEAELAFDGATLAIVDDEVGAPPRATASFRGAVDALGELFGPGGGLGATVALSTRTTAAAAAKAPLAFNPESAPTTGTAFQPIRPSTREPSQGIAATIAIRRRPKNARADAHHVPKISATPMTPVRSQGMRVRNSDFNIGTPPTSSNAARAPRTNQPRMPVSQADDVAYRTNSERFKRACEGRLSMTRVNRSLKVTPLRRARVSLPVALPTRSRARQRFEAAAGARRVRRTPGSTRRSGRCS